MSLTGTGTGDNCEREEEKNAQNDKKREFREEREEGVSDGGLQDKERRAAFCL